MNSPQVATRRSIRLGHVTQLGFGTVLLLLLGISGISEWSMNTILEANHWVIHSNNVESELRGLEKLLLDAENGQWGFIYTNAEDFLEPYTRAIAAIDTDIADLKKLLRDNPEQIRRLEQLEELIQDKLKNLDETIQFKRAGQEKALMQFVLSRKGKQMMDEIRQQIETIRQTEKILLEQRQKNADQAEQITSWILLGGTALAVVIGISVLLVIARRIIQPIRQVTEVIIQSSNEIAATVSQQEQSATQLASAVTQTTSIMDELEASSQQSAEQAKVAASAAANVSDLAGTGTHTVGNTLKGMEALQQKVAVISTQIEALNEQTRQIGNITDLVGNLANQTNMLALNAAVEAVRAGEHGRGFAVVASEIRKLADQSKQSVDQINTLILNIRNAIQSTTGVTKEGIQMVQAGVISTQGTADTFLQVTDAIGSVVISSQQISLTAKQQAIATQQVVTAMNGLNEGAMQTTTGISQTRVSTQQLNEAAKSLKEII